MTRLPAIVAAVSLLAAAPNAQNLTAPDPDKEAIRQAAYDYAEGYYQGAVERMERALHPLLTKRGLMGRDGSQAVLVPMNADTLIEATRAGGGKATPEQARNISYALLDIRADMASAKIFTAAFNDYLHVVKVDGRWQLANVLWTPPSPTAAVNADADRTALVKVFADYFAAVPAADVATVERLVHPEVALRTFGPGPTGRLFIREGTREMTVETIRQRRAGTPPNPAAVVLDSYGDIASVLVTAGQTVSYWHLARQNGQWRMVNRLSR